MFLFRREGYKLQVGIFQFAVYSTEYYRVALYNTQLFA